MSDLVQQVSVRAVGELADRRNGVAMKMSCGHVSIIGIFT